MKKDEYNTTENKFSAKHVMNVIVGGKQYDISYITSIEVLRDNVELVILKITIQQGWAPIVELTSANYGITADKGLVTKDDFTTENDLVDFITKKDEARFGKMIRDALSKSTKEGAQRTMSIPINNTV